MSRIWPISFNKRFVERVENGTKTQTIRKERKGGKVPVAGDWIHCYFGLRTKHSRILRTAVIKSVHQVDIYLPLQQVWIDGDLLSARSCEKLARADGFHSFGQMMAWWLETHAPARFTGFMIKWEETRR